VLWISSELSSQIGWFFEKEKQNFNFNQSINQKVVLIFLIDPLNKSF